MSPQRKARDLARRLVALEAQLRTTALQTEPASVRVYERLRRQLGAPVGADGFQSLACRALALAKSESPRLEAVQITADGVLRGLSQVESLANTGEDGEAGILLIAQLLGLFLTLLGESTTLRLIEDLRLQANDGAELATAAADTVDTVSEECVTTAAFEDLLLEIDRLRKVSWRIEALAGKHTGMEEGLLSVAGNIRSIATVLDVFTLIRSKAGDAQEDPPFPQTNGYMN
jgi:transcriptional antiterminator Rof (Rho-off)